MPKKSDTRQRKSNTKSAQEHVPQQDIFTILMYGLALHQKGELAEAKAVYEKVLTKNPKNFDALHLLGVIAAESRNHLLAADLMGKAIDVNPHNAAAYSNRSVVLHELKRFEEALASCDRAITITPDYADAHYNRGKEVARQN